MAFDFELCTVRSGAWITLIDLCLCISCSTSDFTAFPVLLSLYRRVKPVATKPPQYGGSPTTALTLLFTKVSRLPDDLILQVHYHYRLNLVLKGSPDCMVFSGSLLVRVVRVLNDEACEMLIQRVCTRVARSFTSSSAVTMPTSTNYAPPTHRRRYCASLPPSSYR